MAWIRHPELVSGSIPGTAMERMPKQVRHDGKRLNKFSTGFRMTFA